MPAPTHPLIDEPASRPAAPRCCRSANGLRFLARRSARPRPDHELGTCAAVRPCEPRTGYWWNSGIDAGPRATASRHVTFCAAVSLRARVHLPHADAAALRVDCPVPGPWDRFWHLSDGGFFEILGAYELIRRRVPRIIVCDASADPNYEMGSFANLVRKVRIDFHAEIVPF